MLYDRGINVSHRERERKRRFIVGSRGSGNSVSNLEKKLKILYSWKMDETYIEIKGKWHYLYRAIDADGLTLIYHYLKNRTHKQGLYFC